MINGTERYLQTIEYLGKLYDYCNEKLFNGELVRPVITVQQDAKNKTYGWWSCNKVWKDGADDEGEHELNITAQQLHRPILEIAATMLHEMCHQYAQVNSIQDTSRSNLYHNKMFKRIAEQHGLVVECVKTYGWTLTTLTAETAKLIESFVSANGEKVISRLPVTSGQRVKSSCTRKYVCPCCGMSVRATKQVNIKCADCDEFMTCEE